MTAIACWIADEGDGSYLYLIGDSRVTVPGSPTTTYTDKCAKIFSLPVICRIIEPSASVFYERRVGFAYAGSALIGLNAATAIGTLFSGLSTVPHIAPPSMEQLAEMARNVFSNIALDIGAVKKETAEGAEAAICGYCPLHQTYEAYHLKPGYLPSGKYQAQAVKIPPCDVLLLGECQPEIHRRIAVIRSRYSPVTMNWSSAPLSVIDHAIRTRLSPSIGGCIQLAMDRGAGMELWSVCEPIVPGESPARMMVQGFDMDNVAAPPNYLPITKGISPGPHLEDDYLFE